MKSSKIRELKKLCPPGTVFRATGKQHIAIQIPGVVGEVITASTPKSASLNKVKKQISNAIRTGVANPTVRNAVRFSKKVKI